MKKLLKHILKFLKDTLYFVGFLVRVIYNRNYCNHLQKSKNLTGIVLANGPSLREEIPNLTTDEKFKGVDFIVLNFFAFEEVFFNIKPIHYCFADPMFFKKTSHRHENVKKLFALLQSGISWDINVYIPSQKYNDFIEYSGLTNSHIKIVKMNIMDYFGYEKFRNFFYKKGLAMPAPYNVSNMAIYTGINLRYETLKLYGVDHTFFDSLCVNDSNQLCNRETHFYNPGEWTLKPVIRNDNEKIFKISDYIDSIMLMFRSHDRLNTYATYMNMSIINCTQNSLIDSYPREISNR